MPDSRVMRDSAGYWIRYPAGPFTQYDCDSYAGYGARRVFRVADYQGVLGTCDRHWTVFYKGSPLPPSFESEIEARGFIRAELQKNQAQPHV